MTRRKRTQYFLFAVYIIVMGYLLFGRQEAPGGIPYVNQLIMRMNLTPFHTIRRQLTLLFDARRPHLIRHALINLTGNVVLFFPLGAFLPLLFGRLNRLWKVLLVSGAAVTAIELAQVLTLLGRCDIDDLILNLIGTAIGYGLHKRIRKTEM